MEKRNQQTWVVILRMHAAARFREDERIRIEASTASTAPVHVVELHNDYVGPVEDGLSHRGLRFDVSGGPESLAEAAAILGGIGGAYANVLSVACNAFVGEPRLSVIYRLPEGDQEGVFFQRFQVNAPTSPPSVVRSLRLKETGRFVDALDQSSERDRLFRSCAHYAEALRHWHEFEALVAGESLWIAAETLGPIILRRALADHGVTKAELAEKFGFKPDPAGGTKHLYELDAHLMKTHVFEGDEDCFLDLKAVSHGFEHGFSEFDQIRRKAEAVRDSAARYIRAAILREARLDDDAVVALTSEPFDEVQGGWEPYIEMEGKLLPIDNSNPTEFIGLPGHAFVEGIVDSPDDKRQVSIKLAGSGSTIPEALRVTVESTRVWLPGTKYLKLGEAKSEIQVTHKDGTTDIETGAPQRDTEGES